MTIHYHTRRYGTDDKITAGAIHSVPALLSDYTVTVLPSGRTTLVDDKGRHVNVYMRLDPEDHPGYTEAVKAYRRDHDRAEQIARLLNDMSDEEILARLTE